MNILVTGCAGMIGSYLTSHLLDLFSKKDGNMVGLQNNEVVLTPLKKAVKGVTKINKELLKVSDIMSI